MMMKIYLNLPIILYGFTLFIPLTYSWDKPLIFNPVTLEIYDIGDEWMTYYIDSYVVACPASNEYEREFNQKYSLHNNALFVRHYSQVKDDLIHHIRCKSSVEISVAYYNDPNMKKKFLTFGYEIYFIAGTYQTDKSQITSYFDYEQVVKSKNTGLELYLKPPQMLSMFDVRTQILQIMDFTWISKTTVIFINAEKLRIDGLVYKIGKKVTRPSTDCYDYSLHGELYKDWNLDSFYSFENQEKVFKRMILPDNGCEPKNVCVMKYSMIPAYQLQINNSKPPSCMNIATLPVWSTTTAPLLDHLDKFLFAVSQVIDNLTIFPVAYDTLVLQVANTERPKFQHMYLNQNHMSASLPIPRFIFKLAMYQSHECNEKKKLCWFQVLIVINNEPNLDKVGDKLCQEDKCEELGWLRMQYSNTSKPHKKSERIYCCELNENLKELLGYPKTTIYEDLNLAKVPSYNKDTDTFTYENKVNQIENVMNYLFGGESSTARQKSWAVTDGSQNMEYIYL